ncbi:replicative helicase loader/inhibitor [Neobacillus muris]|uniref:replicative helicase loader/inhibitor n=1 Tax=Neobacillus muris TaxID=2941334 RepID=UPI00203D638C|nr:replicative helicase loader/inhibitor [Neobacillus muris]
MTKDELIKLLVLIENVYPKFTFKNETIQQWFEFCGQMDFEKVMAKLTKHIRNNPFPPAIADIAVFPYEKNESPQRLQKWMMKVRARMEHEHCKANLTKLPYWLAEYSARKGG